MGPALGQLTIQREQTHTASPDPCCVLLWMCPLCYSLICRTEHPEGLWEACADPQNSTPTVALPVPGGARHFSSGLFSKFLGVLPVGISTETQNIPRAESRCSVNGCQMKTLGKLLSPQYIPSDSVYLRCTPQKGTENGATTPACPSKDGDHSRAHAQQGLAIPQNPGEC